MTFTRTPISPLEPASDDGPSAWARSQPQDGSFNVAGPAGWMARRAMQLNPKIEPAFRSTVRGFVGAGAFSDKELEALENRALDAAEMKDLDTFKGVSGGSPVMLNPAQKARVDGLMDKLGNDDLGRRARDAYGTAVKNGQIRVH